MFSKSLIDLTTVQKLEAESILFAFIIIIGSYALHYIEGRSYFNSFYFSIITLAGIGYGDIVPLTNQGKGIVMFYAIIGLPLFITIGYLLSSILLAPINRTRKRLTNRNISIETQLQKAQTEKKQRQK